MMTVARIAVSVCGVDCGRGVCGPDKREKRNNAVLESLGGWGGEGCLATTVRRNGWVGVWRPSEDLAARPSIAKLYHSKLELSFLLLGHLLFDLLSSSSLYSTTLRSLAIMCFHYQKFLFYYYYYYCYFPLFFSVNF